ncbi:hypothetical protein KAU11_06200 [Candidatus Babeliales bacterium]|nr:hypothetical protein [Candidatus Babeliales bacterium]
MKKTDEAILKAEFNSLSDDEQAKFYELKTIEIEEKYGKLVPKNTKTHTIILENGLGCILNNPKPNVLSQAFGALSGMKGDPDLYKAGSIILNNCWVAGNLEIQDNDDFRFAAALQAINIIEVLQGSIKKTKFNPFKRWWKRFRKCFYKSKRADLFPLFYFS